MEIYYTCSINHNDTEKHLLILILNYFHLITYTILLGYEPGVRELAAQFLKTNCDSVVSHDVFRFKVIYCSEELLQNQASNR